MGTIFLVIVRMLFEYVCYLSTYVRMLFEYICHLTSNTTTFQIILMFTMTKLAKLVYSRHPFHFFPPFIMFIDIFTSGSHVLIKLLRGTLVFLY